MARPSKGGNDGGTGPHGTGRGASGGCRSESPAGTANYYCWPLFYHRIKARLENDEDDFKIEV
jgi:hypothetical protein